MWREYCKGAVKECESAGVETLKVLEILVAESGLVVEGVEVVLQGREAEYISSYESVLKDLEDMLVDMLPPKAEDLMRDSRMSRTGGLEVSDNDLKAKAAVTNSLQITLFGWKEVEQVRIALETVRQSIGGLRVLGNWREGVSNATKGGVGGMGDGDMLPSISKKYERLFAAGQSSVIAVLSLCAQRLSDVAMAHETVGTMISTLATMYLQVDYQVMYGVNE